MEFKRQNRMKKPSYVIKKAEMLENKEILLPNGKTYIPLNNSI